MSQCYQEQGALQMQFYAKENDALLSGVAAIVDENRLTSPEVLLTCSAKLAGGGGPNSLTSVSPCATNYTLEKDSNKFHIAYAATSVEVCAAFCSQLEGCTEHR
jgi:hypothetical protein